LKINSHSQEGPGPALIANNIETIIKFKELYEKLSQYRKEAKIDDTYKNLIKNHIKNKIKRNT